MVNLEAIEFEFWTERSQFSDGENLCPLWSVILKSVWNSVGDTFELRYSWPWAEVNCTLLAAVPGNRLEHSHRKARLCVGADHLTLEGGGGGGGGVSKFFFSQRPGGQDIFFPPKCSAGYFFSLLTSLQDFFFPKKVSCLHLQNVFTCYIVVIINFSLSDKTWFFK